MADRFEIDCYSKQKSQRAFDFITSAKIILKHSRQTQINMRRRKKADDLRNICYWQQLWRSSSKAVQSYGSFGLCRSITMFRLPIKNVPETYKAVPVPADLAYDEGSQADFSEFGLSYASSLGLYDYTSYAVVAEVTGYSTLNVYDSNLKELYPCEVGKQFITKDESGYERYTNDDCLQYSRYSGKGYS